MRLVRTVRFQHRTQRVFLALTELRRENSVSSLLLFVRKSELTEFCAELTDFAAELSELRLPKQSFRNSIPPVS